jgi:ureidoglycolate lyase
MDIIAQPLTAEAFAAFGDVFAAPSQPGRTYIDAALGNARGDARLCLSVSRLTPFAEPEIAIKYLERHEFSSQTFIPMEVSRALVVVAPSGPDGGPDAAGLRAFVADAGQGFTYRMNVWHHGMTVLDAPASYAIVMHRTGGHDGPGPGDEEFVDLPQPVIVALPKLGAAA